MVSDKSKKIALVAAGLVAAAGATAFFIWRRTVNSPAFKVNKAMMMNEEAQELLNNRQVEEAYKKVDEAVALVQSITPPTEETETVTTFLASSMVNVFLVGGDAQNALELTQAVRLKHPNMIPDIQILFLKHSSNAKAMLRDFEGSMADISLAIEMASDPEEKAMLRDCKRQIVEFRAHVAAEEEKAEE